MYKLFLCLRYLKSRIIAYFAVLAVALCVAMMLIVISVMNGFLDKIEGAAKGLFGDVVVSSSTLSGLGRYDEFIAEVRQKVPQVQAGSPFILTLGILRVPGPGNEDYRQGVQIAGIRLPERATVTEFEKGLFASPGPEGPTFDPAIDTLLKAVLKHNEETSNIYLREIGPDSPVDLPPEKARLQERLLAASQLQRQASWVLTKARAHQGPLAQVQRNLDAALAASGGQEDQAVQKLSEELDSFAEKADYDPPARRIIVGLGVPGLSFRTDRGETVRYIVPGHKLVLSLLPLGRGEIATDITPNTARFTVVNDCRTDVYSIDSELVYIPFDTLQQLNNMGPQYAADDPTRQVSPARCTQIHLKVRDEYSKGKALMEVCDKVQGVWNDFHERYPDATTPGVDVSVETWRQRQAKVIAPIQQQRTLVVIMFGIISMVSVVLIFVIFYTIVVQKTRDIGVMKAVGASDGGVALIFLTYGAAIGLVGSILGCIGGYYFVRYINPIQDALDTWFGFRVWSREWFLFEEIPNQVAPTTALAIAIGAIAAGLAGAIIPAVRAARMQPVEALRYE